MARIIFTTMYHRNAPKAKIRNLVNYIATRPGVMIDKGMRLAQPATETQKNYIRSIETLSPEIKDTFEYEDYTANPTAGNAQALLEKFIEDNLGDSADIKNYVDYIARRPRAERTAGAHGLWTGGGDPIVLSRVADEAANHKGLIWTHVVSLRREDAARLGYDNAATWRVLVKRKLPVIAEAMNIPIDDLRWYGAFHDEGIHPHIHLMVYSEHYHYTGRLYNSGIEKMRSAFATDIFKHDLMHIYEQRTEVRKELNMFADERIRRLAEQIRSRDYENPVIEEMFMRLSYEVKKIKGRKVYGNLKGAEKQAAKNLVDAIVAELGKDRDIAEIYERWCDLQDEIKLSYMKTAPPPTALVDEKEFTTIKNMVLRCAEGLDEVDRATDVSIERRPTNNPATDGDGRRRPRIVVPERHHRQPTAVSSAASLLKNVSRIIADDYFERLERHNDRVDRKLLTKILRKKQEHGMKITLE